MEITYETVPQREYLIEGQPARTYGEWPGIKSNHWKGSVRIIRPATVTGRIFDDGIYKNQIGKRHFQRGYSNESIFIPGRRPFPQKKNEMNIEEKKTGIKKVDITFTGPKLDYQRRHYDPKFGYEILPQPYYIKTFRPCDTYNCSNKETSLEKEIGGKMRIYSLIQQRNGFDLRIPGDKFYKLSEQFPRFFHDGGLIPGSTNRINYNKTQSKKGYNFYETIDLSIPTLDPNKIWKNKCKNEDFAFDNNYVGKNIDNWEKTILNDYFPDLGKKDKVDVKNDKNDKNAKAGNAKAKGKKK